MFLESTISDIENYPFLNPFRFENDPSKKYWHISTLESLLEENWNSIEEGVTENREYLAAREKIFSSSVFQYFTDQKNRIIQESLETDNSFQILGAYTCLLDSIVQTAFDYSFIDIPLIKERLVEELNHELNYKQKNLPEKKEKLKLLKEQILEMENNLESGSSSSREYRYFQEVESQHESETRILEERIEELQQLIPQIQEFTNDKNFVLNHLVIFARGGYGRAELGLSSDRDLGYCLDTNRLNNGEAEMLRQLIVHIENLLRNSGVETAHQYFEIDEDLSRFDEVNTLHTIPSILESRVLLGSESLATNLKNRFFQVITFEPYVLNLVRSFSESKEPELNRMDLKMDYGGLRSLQIPLWITAATFGIFPSQTADLLAFLIQKHLLSHRQALKLCQALEFLHDLRNFSAVAKEHYFDDEARDIGCVQENLLQDQLNDSLERLYLLKKNRFKNVDEFDRFRLQMMEQIGELSKVILDRLLDRTIVRTFSKFQVVVHLGNRRVVEIHALEGLPQVPLTLIFDEPQTLLELFVYLGHSDYDLTYDLKDEMASLIAHFTPELMKVNQHLIAEKFSELMLTPYAANVLELMFDISDTIGSTKTPQTLIGCFLPECNQMRFLLRNLTYHQHPVCKHTLNALRNAQLELNRLRENYPELYQFLKPSHILALKWGMLFHDVGKIDPQTKHQISGTAIASNALERLGYDDPEMTNLVSLLIVHHMTVVQLSKTSAYFDQALQSFFEIADRNLVNVILLYLCNISDYSAVSESNARDTRNLRNFFDETYRVFAEMRTSNQEGDPIDFILTYLDQKKIDLVTDTRIDLLINRSLQYDLEKAIFEPLKSIHSEELKALNNSKDELNELWRALKLGSLDAEGRDKVTDKLIRKIKQAISETSLKHLTANYNSVISWFFAALPNRFLLGTPPGILSANLQMFQRLDRPAIVSVQANARGRLTGLLIYVHDQPRIHSKVAYALSLKRLNIESGKMNRIVFAGEKVAYCYFLKISVRERGEMIFPREMENSILNNPPPELKIQPQDFVYNTRMQLEYLDDDQKGYVISQETSEKFHDFPVWLGNEPETEQFSRIPEENQRVKITVTDAPLVYFKIIYAFERVGIKIQQAVITTIGHQVIDTFYIKPSDLEKLRLSDFEEYLKQSLMSPSEI